MGVHNPLPLEIRDEGVSQGFARAIDFVGAGVAAAVAGSVATVLIPGGSGGGLTYTELTQDLGTARRSGTFDITGLAGLTAGKIVNVVQTPAQIASKGDARDEPELDLIVATGYVVDATTIRVYWFSANGSVVVGTYAFAYAVSA